MFKFLALIHPFLPLIGTVIASILVALVPIYMMRLQKKSLLAQIEQIKQNIVTSKTTAVRDEATALETLGRVTQTTADELEKSLEKSVTIRKLMEKIDDQKTQIDQLTNDLASEHLARVAVEGQLTILQGELAKERAERQTALAEVSNLKSNSDKVIKKLTARVKVLEDYILSKSLPLPNGN